MEYRLTSGHIAINAILNERRFCFFFLGGWDLQSLDTIDWPWIERGNMITSIAFKSVDMALSTYFPSTRRVHVRRYHPMHFQCNPMSDGKYPCTLRNSKHDHHHIHSMCCMPGSCRHHAHNFFLLHIAHSRYIPRECIPKWGRSFQQFRSAHHEYRHSIPSIASNLSSVASWFGHWHSPSLAWLPIPVSPPCPV